MAFSLVLLTALVASAYSGVVPQVGFVNHGLYNGLNGFVQPALGVAKAPVLAQPLVNAAVPVNAGLVQAAVPAFVQPAVAAHVPVNQLHSGLVPAASFVQPKAALVQPAVAVSKPVARVAPVVSKPVGFVAQAAPVVAKTGFGFGTFPSFAKNVPFVADKSFGLGFGDFADFGSLVKAPVVKAPVFDSFPAKTLVQPAVKKAVVAAPAVPAVNKALLPTTLSNAKGFGLVQNVGVLPVGAVQKAGLVQNVAVPAQFHAGAFLPAAVQPALVKQAPAVVSAFPQAVAAPAVVPAFNKAVAAPAVVSAFPKAVAAPAVVSAFPKAAAVPAVVPAFPKAAVAVPVHDRSLPLNVPALSVDKTGVQLPATEPFANDFAGFSGNGEFQLIEKSPKGFFANF